MARLEFDSTSHWIENDDTGERLFRCKSNFQYNDLCEILLSPSQWVLHIGLSKDGIYRVSEKKIKKGVEFMANNIWNKP